MLLGQLSIPMFGLYLDVHPLSAVDMPGGRKSLATFTLNHERLALVVRKQPVRDGSFTHKGTKYTRGDFSGAVPVVVEVPIPHVGKIAIVAVE